MDIILNVLISIILIFLLFNCIGIDKYSQNINIIHNRCELNEITKYSQLQTNKRVEGGKLVEYSGKLYCEYWCNPDKKHGNYILDPKKIKYYDGKPLQYGKDIHEHDFPIIIPDGCIEKTHIYFDIDNLKFLFNKLKINIKCLLLII